MSCCENNLAEAAIFSDCGCADAVNDIRPILCREQYRQSYRECCDQNGRCCRYPCSARDPFWPEFTHPRGLSCAELYNGQDSRCMRSTDSCSCDCN